MINAEKYRTEIQKIRKDDKNVGICRKTGELFACDPYDTDDIPCKDCLMHDGIRECKNAVVDWLLEETPKYILPKFEYLFLKSLNKKFKYIARRGGDVYTFRTESNALKGIWDSVIYRKTFDDSIFDFIAEKPNEYYSIEDILEHSQVIENDKEE